MVSRMPIPNDRRRNRSDDVGRARRVSAELNALLQTSDAETALNALRAWNAAANADDVDSARADDSVQPDQD